MFLSTDIKVSVSNAGPYAHCYLVTQFLIFAVGIGQVCVGKCDSIQPNISKNYRFVFSQSFEHA